MHQRAENILEKRVLFPQLNFQSFSCSSMFYILFKMKYKSLHLICPKARKSETSWKCIPPSDMLL